MPSEVILPRVDMDMATGKISRWFVEAGARVDKGQPLFEIETDKAAMEIEAQASGTIRDLAAPSGEDIPVGSVVAWIYAEGESPAEAVVRPAMAPNGRLAEAAPAARLDAEVRPTGPALADGILRPRATPLARRLARERGLDLASLKGSGPRGRIQAGDVGQTLAAETPVNLRHSDDAGLPQADAPAPLPAGGRPAGALNLVRLREGSGAPLLLLHGFGSDANSWRPFLAARRSGRPVYALDLPGHGLSPLGRRRSFADVVDAVEAALTGAGLPSLDLVGHSLGGGIAAALAARGALDLRSLLLLSPAGLGPEINGDFLRGYLGAASEVSLTPWMHELVADPAVVSAAFVRETLKARQGGSLVESQGEIARTLFPDSTQSFSVRAEIAGLDLPVRVVFGLADRIIPARHARGLPGSVALHLFANVGHLPHLEARDDVARILAQMGAV